MAIIYTPSRRRWGSSGDGGPPKVVGPGGDGGPPKAGGTGGQRRDKLSS